MVDTSRPRLEIRSKAGVSIGSLWITMGENHFSAEWPGDVNWADRAKKRWAHSCPPFHITLSQHDLARYKRASFVREV